MKIGKLYLVSVLLISVLLLGCVQNSSQATFSDSLNSSVSSLSGTYRCWSYNVQGAGKSCTSPPLVLHSDGTYSMSSEQGTYSVNGDFITLSESKIRGSGKILENGMQIRFEYEYNGWTHTVTYLKMQESKSTNSNFEKADVKLVEVSLNIVFQSESEARSISTASLVAKGENTPAGEALVYESKPKVVTALFRKYGSKSGIETGKVYDVLVSTGFGSWKVGEIDLTSVRDDIEIEIIAQSENLDSQSVNQPPAISQSSEQNTITNDNSLPICDPNIPKYSQPTCRDE